MTASTIQGQRNLALADSQDLAARWRELAVYLYSAVDLSLDCSNSERVSILTEAACEADAQIDDLDGLAMAAEGRAA